MDNLYLSLNQLDKSRKKSVFFQTNSHLVKSMNVFLNAHCTIQCHNHHC